MIKIPLFSVHLYRANGDGDLTSGSWIDSLKVGRTSQLTFCRLKKLFSGEQDLILPTQLDLEASGEDNVESMLDDLLADVEAAQH